jgi:hypothetical protein
MKLLISAACAALIGTGTVHAAESNADIEAARTEIFRFAGATPDDIKKVRFWCSNLSEGLDNGTITDSDFGRRLETNCRAFGYL